MEKWKSYVKEEIKNYCKNKAEIKEIEQSAVYKSVNRDGQPNGSGTSDRTCQSALILAGDERLERLRKAVEAVEYAIYITERSKKGKAKMDIVKMVYLKKTHTLYGAAMEVITSERQAKRWNSEFIEMVGKKMGFF